MAGFAVNAGPGMIFNLTIRRSLCCPGGSGLFAAIDTPACNYFNTNFVDL
jgi:hypothetical protein